MNKKIILKGKIQINKADNKITVIASDETLDRHGDVLPIDQWDLTKFLLSPRMLVDHNHEVSSIVGKWDNTRIEGRKLLMDANFHEITELSKAVKGMVEQGYLDTVSVGFIFNGPTENGGKASFELIETSWVTVPANPNARVTRSLLDSVTAEQKEQIKTLIADEPEELESSDDLLPDDVEEEVEPELNEDGTPKVPVEEPEKIFGSVDEVKKEKLEGKEFVKVKLSFLMELIGCSEKLQTLTEAELAKVGADKAAKVMSIAFKEAAHIVNDSLRKLNSKA